MGGYPWWYAVSSAWSSSTPTCGRDLTQSLLRCWGAAPSGVLEELVPLWLAVLALFLGFLVGALLGCGTWTFRGRAAARHSAAHFDVSIEATHAAGGPRFVDGRFEGVAGLRRGGGALA